MTFLFYFNLLRSLSFLKLNRTLSLPPFLPPTSTCFPFFFFLLLVDQTKYMRRSRCIYLLILKHSRQTCLVFSILKYYFIYFNTSLYNISNIKGFIFFTTSLKYYLFIIYNSFFFLYEPQQTHNQPLNQSAHSHQREFFHQREIDNPQPQPITNHYNQPLNQSTHTHKSTQHPQINPHHRINLTPTNQPTPITSKPPSTQPHSKHLMSSVALSMEATDREHVHNTFDEALEKTATAAPSLSLCHSLLLKWRSRVKKRWGGIKKEREREREREESNGERHTTREREKERKNLATCYNRVSKMTLHCSQDVKNFKNRMLNVDDILKERELKFGFSIFHIFYVNTLKGTRLLFLIISNSSVPCFCFFVFL